MSKRKFTLRRCKAFIPVMLIPLCIYIGKETSKQITLETKLNKVVTEHNDLTKTSNTNLTNADKPLSWTNDNTVITNELNWNNLGNVLPVLDEDYTITLDKDLQNYIYDTSAEFGVPYELTLAVCYMESKFTADVNNAGTNTDGTTDWGIMGLNDLYLQANCDLYNNGIMIDAYNPYQNIYIGVQILASNLNYFNGSILDAANAYNLGPAGWENMKSCGQSWYYGDTVLRYIDVLKTMI